MPNRGTLGHWLALVWNMRLGLTIGAGVLWAVPVQAQDPVAPLVAGLRSSDPTVRLAAATLMSNVVQAARTQYTPQAKQTVIALRQAGPELAKLVGDADARVRRAAAEALGHTRAPGAAAGPAWSEALRDRNVAVRVAAAKAIGVHALTVPEESKVQIQIVDRLPGLQRFVEEAPELLKPLDLALRDADAEVRSAGLQSLVQLLSTLDTVGLITATEVGGPAQAAHEALKQGLQPLARALAVLVPGLNKNLNGADSATEHAIPSARALEELARISLTGSGAATNRGSLVRPILQPEGQAAADILVAALRKALPGLSNALKNADDQVQLGALEALEMLGPESASTIPALTATLADDNPFVRWAAARTLGKVGRADAGVIRGLARLLGDPDLDVRIAASAALGQFGERGAAAVPELSRAVAQGDPDLQTAAMRSLKEVGPAVKDSVPALRTALKSPETRVRRAAADLLGDIGLAARPAVPTLESALSDPEADVRQAAGQALLKILMPK